jgi:hypothetical protein
MKSEVSGVSFHTSKQMWRVTHFINGKSKHLGYFESQKEAEDFSSAFMLGLFGEVRKKAAAKGAYPARLQMQYAKMKDRCYRPLEQSYEYYGARGIGVCDKWLASSTAFYEWAMANGWAPGLQLDRINVDGMYGPENCRFVTQTTNVRNRREQLSDTVGTCLIRGRWRAHIRVDGRLITLGRFDNRADAIVARKAGERKYWGTSEPSTANN